MTETLKTISPVDGRVYVERPLETAAGMDRALDTAQRAQRAWASLTLAARGALLSQAVDAFVAKAGDIAAEITWQMGRPIRHSPGEIRGFEERARYMLNVAPEALAAVQPGASAGVPAGVFQYLHLSHANTARLMGDSRVANVCFTGSVSGGRAVVEATAAGFATSGLELGGKDPAYVRSDANLAHAIETLTDGAFYNAGQSCCGIKRIYVAGSRYGGFVDGVVELTKKYRLGSPLDPETSIGPLVRTSAAEAVRTQVREAIAHGARQLIDEAGFAASARGTPYLAPQVLVDVDHSMAIMRDETFGPAVGIMKVASDDEALRLMNDSEFGLTAAIFSADAARAEALGDALETGTVFLNRCDYLDPALAWPAVTNSGRACTLSRVA